MKRFLSVIIIIAICSCAAKAEVVGSVLSTDIVAYIDNMPVPAYNIDGSTAVIVRDLEHYGFTVMWNEAERKVTFYRDFSLPVDGIVPLYTPALSVGTKLFDVHSTDIRTYLGDTEITSYNIGGRTAVLLRDIKLVGEAQFDAETKSAYIGTYEVELFEDEVEYMRKIFSQNMFRIGKAEYYQQQLHNKISDGICTSKDIKEFEDIMNEIYAEFDKFQTYREPYGFSDSAMELWWAMVNTRLASDILLQMANGGDIGALSAEYNASRNDSVLQRQRAMSQLYSDIMSVAFMWD